MLFGTDEIHEHSFSFRLFYTVYVHNVINVYFTGCFELFLGHAITTDDRQAYSMSSLLYTHIDVGFLRF